MAEIVVSDPQWAPLYQALRRAATGGHVNVAYSGGFDSRFLAFCAKEMGFSVSLWHITGPHIPLAETQEALERAKVLGLTVRTVPTDPTKIADFVAAGINRCYVCKRAVFATLLSMVGGNLVDGSNATDSVNFRPGARALRELGVFSPWVEGGYTKPRMREMARSVGFPDPDQPSRPCMMTRFPYGVTPERQLMQIATEVERGMLEKYPTLSLRCRFPDGVNPVVHVGRASVEERGEDFLNQLSEDILRLTGRSIPVEVQDVLSGYFDRVQKVNQ